MHHSRLGRHLWDDGHSLAQGVQTDLRSQKTIYYDSSLRLSQPEQGGDQGAFTGPSPPNDANLHPEKEAVLILFSTVCSVARTHQSYDLRFLRAVLVSKFKGCIYIVFVLQLI